MTPPNARVRIVSSFEELLNTRFADGVNALCWPRMLEGDFAEVLNHLDVEPGITALETEHLQALPLSADGRQAVSAMLADAALLQACGLQPELNCIHGYTHDIESGPMRTDVCSFHADSATVEADTWLCTYIGASSEGLLNEEALRRAELPETRALLWKLYGGVDEAGFAEWLNDHFYDLHYAALPDARPYSFGTHHLWRIATEHPGCAVPPCIHRAPDPVPGQKRLLLIS